MKKNIAGVVVLYEPNIDMLVENITVLCAKIDFLILIDNSKNPIDISKIGISSLDINKVEYVFQNKNVGIAKALNESVRIADENKYEYIFTFDQDSRPTIQMLSDLENTLSELSVDELEEAIIISPTHIEEKYYSKYSEALLKRENTLQEVETVMTSGNLLNIKLCRRIKGFREDFFIDFVDHEFCLRAKSFGLRIYMDITIFLAHNLGNSYKKSFLGKSITVTNHNFIRRYYMTRNRLEIYRVYKNRNISFIREDKNRFVNEIIKIIIFEKDKLRKIISITKGMVDFNRKKFGSYD